VETLVCRSIHPDLDYQGDIYWVPRKYSTVLQNKACTSDDQCRSSDWCNAGTCRDNADSHGSPYDYDQEGPLIVREPGRRHREVRDQVPAMLRVAPTLARMLGVSAPKTARESPLE